MNVIVLTLFTTGCASNNLIHKANEWSLIYYKFDKPEKAYYDEKTLILYCQTSHKADLLHPFSKCITAVYGISEPVNFEKLDTIKPSIVLDGNFLENRLQRNAELNFYYIPTSYQNPKFPDGRGAYQQILSETEPKSLGIYISKPTPQGIDGEFNKTFFLGTLPDKNGNIKYYLFSAPTYYDY